MPSPFPGMDPWLEDPALWPGVHHRFVTYLADALMGVLPPRYVVNITERTYLEEAGRDIYPDSSVLELPASATGSVATATAGALTADPPWVVSTLPREVREGFLEILPAPDEGRVITVLEILSPTNKTSAGRGRAEYQTKQRQVLASQTHLVEIDLLRQGQHTVAAPLERLLQRGAYDYLVSLSRGDQRDRCEVWAFTLRQRLPRVRVPLAGTDPDVVLDLQPLLDRCYDLGGYARRLDYRRDPPRPLARPEAEWAEELLRQRGLRT